jgi:hypothetical protein
MRQIEGSLLVRLRGRLDDFMLRALLVNKQSLHPGYWIMDKLTLSYRS